MMKWQLLWVVAVLFIIACKKEAATVNKSVNAAKIIDSTLAFSNVVILGNSITYTAQNPAIGWYGDWGMAATKQDSDYVHLLTKHFQVKNPDVRVQIKNILPFEVDAEHYNFDDELKSLRDSKPDLVIIRIGENIPVNADLDMFDKRYTALINYFKTGNPNVIVLGGGSVWGSVIDDVMVKYPPFILLKSIVNDGSNFSHGLYADPGIQAHPSDKGMRNIANMLWTRIKMLRLADSH